VTLFEANRFTLGHAGWYRHERGIGSLPAGRAGKQASMNGVQESLIADRTDHNSMTVLRPLSDCRAATPPSGTSGIGT
jgi:hypothetical protein